MKPLIQSHPVIVSLEHSISSSKILQARYDLHQSIRSVKENIVKRYGTDIGFMKLVLKDNKSQTVSPMDDDNRTLGMNVLIKHPMVVKMDITSM